MNYNLNINFDSYFRDLVFIPKSHTYELSGDKKVKFYSVTGLVNKLATPPDVNVIAAKRGVDPVELAKEWKEKAQEAASFGTRIHSMIEHYLNKGEFQKSDMLNDPKTKLILNGFVRFHEKYKNKWDFVKQEYRVYDYSGEWGVAGTIDCIVWNKEEKCYELLDWKSNKAIDRTFWHPLKIYEDKGDNSFNKYSIQLSLYKWILENNIPGLDIKKLNIIHLMPEGTEVIEAEEFDVVKMLENLDKII